MNMRRDIVAIVIVGLTLVMGSWISPVKAAQDADPKKHDNAEARQLLGQAEQAAAKITDKEKRVTALEDVAIAKAEAGDYDGARLIARALETNESKAKILEKMALQQMLGGDTDTGLKTVGGIGSGDGKIKACGSIIDELVDAKMGDAALSVLAYAFEVKLPDDEKVIFDLLVLGHAMAKAGKPEGTSSMAAASKEKGAPWDDINTTLYAMAKAYNHDIMGAKAKYAGIHVALFQVMALEAIADVQSKSGDKKGAAATFKQMTEVVHAASPSPTKLLLTIARLQHDNGDTVGCQATIDLTLDIAGKKKDDSEIDLVAARQADIGDLEGALKTLALIKEPNNQTMARKSIASAKAKAGDVSGALASTPKDADAYMQTEVLVGTASGILESLKPPKKP